MSDVGYVHIYRSLIGHPAFRNDAEAMAFAWMVLRAAWRPVRVRYKERAISLARGQLSISVRDMATALDRDKAWIERLWKRLKSETMIETMCETGVSIVTICNYDEFQPGQDTGETSAKTPRKTQARQGQDTEQRREKGKKEEEEEANASPSGAGAPASTRARPDPFPLPNGVDQLDWDGLKANRKAKRAPLTEGAHRQITRKLEAWAEAGWPPGPIVAHAVERGWTSVFETDEMRAAANDRSQNTRRQPAQRSKGDGWDHGLDLLDDAFAAQRPGDTSWAA